jgi:hypothetical protein
VGECETIRAGELIRFGALVREFEPAPDLAMFVVATRVREGFLAG